MENRINKSKLMDTLSTWDRYLKRKVRIIACGGTALTLLGVKESTKDVDLLIPETKDYKYLVKTLADLGYERTTGSGWQKSKGFIFDLFAGKAIFTTELLDSPLDPKNHFLFKEFPSIYLGILNYFDLIITKLFRFTPVDVEDCLELLRVKGDEIDIEKLERRFIETSSFDISDEKNRRNFEYFIDIFKSKK
jgi:hypothetical protein